ncbi:SMI1/KNR4 family protein [Exiguobacterium antarcticum]|uniref:SMI1/KNR4 family protein n=1 Tax=Exiguobacterium antarcticum TaxID=132920 RepID=UPI0002F897CB|nr:SMI1/KNR4 family protein [Exiguobacterium antarcticum]
MNQIAAVLDGLQQKINHGSTFIQRKYNEIGQAKFNFPAPVTATSLAAFEAEFNQKLPSEYQTFLELHDGATNSPFICQFFYQYIKMYTGY